MLSRILQKLQEDQARDLALLWRTQVWFPKIHHMLISQPVLLPNEVSLLQLTHNRSKIHPLCLKLQLTAKHSNANLRYDHGIVEDWHYQTVQGVSG